MGTKGAEFYEFLDEDGPNKKRPQGALRRMISIFWRNIRAEFSRSSANLDKEGEDLIKVIRPDQETDVKKKQSEKAKKQTKRKTSQKKKAYSEGVAAQDNYVHIRLRPEAFAITIAGLVFVVVAAFVGGAYYGRQGDRQLAMKSGSKRIGGAKGAQVLRSQAKAKYPTSGTRTFPRAGTPSTQRQSTRTKPLVERPKPFYSLRLISAIPRKNAEDIVRYLKYSGADVFIQRLRNGKYVVYCGHFSSKDNPQLLILQKKFRRLKYKDQLVFKDCYIVRIQP